jgi:hypothetical protein
MTVVLAIIAASPASARTWTVEKDGSGDYTVLQGALDASADGDTILVGPGRFDTFHADVSTIDGFEFAMIATVRTDVVLLGSGRDQTFVGSATYTGEALGLPAGCLYVDGGAEATIAGFTFENAQGIVTIRHRTVFEDNRVDGSRKDRFATYNVAILNGSNPEFRGCEFIGEDNIISSGVNGVLIEDCTFIDDTLDGTGVSVGGGTNVTVRRCQFEGGALGISFYFGAIGRIEDCEFPNPSFGGISMGGGLMIAENLYIGSSRQPVRCAIGRIEIYNSYIEGGTQYTILSGDEVYARGCHILNAGTEYTVTGPSAEGEITDLRENWWGTTDVELIRSRIDDRNGLVLFEPILGDPVSDATTSFGELKSRFRD